MLKRILILIIVLVVLAIGWFLDLLWSTGQFKTLEPHFAGECKQITGLVGPEDITIHPKNGIAFISASDWRAVLQSKPANGAVYAYDLKAASPKLIHLTPDASDNFHPHGISLYVDENGRDALFVINHEGGRHRIEIYNLKDGQLSRRKTISDPMLISPNDLVAVGPDRFYVSNDHRYDSDIMKVIEDILQLRRSNVVYYDGSRFTEVASGIGYANGLNVSADGKTLYLCAVTEQSLHIYDRDPSSGALVQRETIDLASGVDNIEMDSDGGLWIGAHPQLFKMLQHARDPFKLSPSQVLHLTPRSEGGFDIEEVYLNKGEEISASSVAAVYNKRMLIGAIFDPKFLDCKR